VIVIRDAGAMKKDARKILEKYAEHPSPDVVVILVESSGGKGDKDFVRYATPLEFDNLTADRIPRWIAHYASTEFHVKITTEAIELLHSAAGTDLLQLVSELDKLTSYTGGREIGEADVAAVVGVKRGETMADFLDEVAYRNTSKALELLPHILSQPKTSAVQLVMALTVQAIALAWGKAKRSEGLSGGRLQAEFFNLLKQSGSVFTGRPWGSAVAAWASAVDRWTVESLDKALAALLDADAALKETRVSSEEQVMATLILTMCVEDDRSMAA
jgi:DNA polymerase-3 subunit delta